MDTDYQVEPELRTSVRQAFWTSEARETRKLVTGLLLATFLIGGFFAYRDLSDLYALLRQGREVSALVTGKHETHGKSTAYYLKYSFQCQGEWINDEDDVPSYLYSLTPVGDTVDMTYLPSDPAIHRLGSVDAPRITRRETAWILGVGSIAALFGVMMAAMEYDYRRQMRLAVSGVPVTGSITSCEPPAPNSKITTYAVKYTFTDLQGVARIAGWDAPEARGKQIQVGQNVTILCNAENPKWFCLYMGLNAAQVEGASPIMASGS